MSDRTSNAIFYANFKSSSNQMEKYRLELNTSTLKVTYIWDKLPRFLYSPFTEARSWFNLLCLI